MSLWQKNKKYCEIMFITMVHIVKDKRAGQLISKLKCQQIICFWVICYFVFDNWRSKPWNILSTRSLLL